MKQDAVFCIAQKAFIEKDGKLLILMDPIQGLDFPGGKIQEGEAIDGDPSSLTRALQREVKEETGCEIEVLEPFTVWYHEFLRSSRNYGKVAYFVGFRCRYVSGTIRLSSEHDDFRWVDQHTYLDLNDGTEYFEVLRKYFAYSG